ncbi:MAG: FprA family A-type flavoprotein [Candidatus Lokiarchaeia archaeon]
MSVKLAEGVYWVGAIDWNLRFCGSYETPLGTTYNAYLIVDEKIVLIDAVKHTHSVEMIERIREIVDPKDIDYYIVNHAEPDHAGNFEEILKLAPKAEIICSKRAEDSLNGYYKLDRPLKIVKTGDELNIGKRNLVFIEAQMLHWPDNMMTYLKEDHILFSNDPFGQHIATTERFVDEVGEGIVMDQAARYYAQIVLPYSALVLKKLEEVKSLNVPIDMICPAHGLIWDKKPERIINAYAKWASGEVEDRAVIIFDTMWGSTDMMAREIARGLMDSGVQTTVYRVRFSEWSLMIRDVMLSKILLFGSATLNMTMMPVLRGVLEFIKGLRPPGTKIAAAFESYGWGGGAYKNLIQVLKEMKFEVVEPGPRSKWVPKEEQLKECYEFGKQLAQKVK